MFPSAPGGVWNRGRGRTPPWDRHVSRSASLLVVGAEEWGGCQSICPSTWAPLELEARAGREGPVCLG